MSEPEEFMPGGGQRTKGYQFAAPHSAQAREAVEAILRTSRVARYRVLDVACSGPRSHRLAQVLRTPAGLAVVGIGPITEYRVEKHGGVLYPDDDAYAAGYGGPVDWEVDIEKRNRINRVETVCCLLNDLLPKDSALMQCRCRTEDIPGAWLVAQIAADRRRVVYGYSSPHAGGSVRIAVGGRDDNGRRKVLFLSGDEVDGGDMLD